MRFIFFRSKSDKSKKREKIGKAKLAATNLPDIDDSLVIPSQPSIQCDWYSKPVKGEITVEKPY